MKKTHEASVCREGVVGRGGGYVGVVGEWGGEGGVGGGVGCMCVWWWVFKVFTIFWLGMW